MFRRPSSIILASAVLIAATLSAAMLSGQEPAKKRQAANKKRLPTPAAPPSPVAKVETQPVRFATPGSPEAARLANLTADVQAGRVPIISFGTPPQEDDSQGFQAPDFAPTEIVSQQEIVGDMLAFQAKLSPLFAASDPIPASRTNHFAWLKAHPDVRIYGWHGIVKNVEIQPDASVIVMIRFAPKTKITGRRAIALDYVHEKYLVADGQLQLIDSDAAHINPAIQVVHSF